MRRTVFFSSSSLSLPLRKQRRANAVERSLSLDGGVGNAHHARDVMSPSDPPIVETIARAHRAGLGLVRFVWSFPRAIPRARALLPKSKRRARRRPTAFPFGTRFIRNGARASSSSHSQTQFSQRIHRSRPPLLLLTVVGRRPTVAGRNDARARLARLALLAPRAARARRCPSFFVSSSCFLLLLLVWSR